MEKKKIEILGVKLLNMGEEVKGKDGFYKEPIIFQCKLGDGSQYLISANIYSHESLSLSSSAIGITVIPQSNGVIVKYPSCERASIEPYDAEFRKEDFSLDVQLSDNNFKITTYEDRDITGVVDGNNFKIMDEDGDFIVGTAVLVPTELHVDFTF